MKIRPKILLAFAVPTVLMLITAVVLFRALTHSLDTAADVDQAQQVIARGNELIKSAVDAQSGQLGYVITTDAGFRGRFTKGNATFTQTASRLRALVADEPEQVARVDQMIALQQRWIDRAAQRTVSAVDAGDPRRAAAIVESGVGPGIIDDLRAVVSEFLDTERRILERRSEASDSSSRSARTLLIGGFGLIVLMELAIGFGLSKKLAESAQEVTRAARRLADGETAARADVQTADEIGELAQAFNSMAERLVQSAEAERQLSDSLQTAVRDYSEFAAKVAGGDLTATVGANGDQDLRVLSENLNSMVVGLADISQKVREGVQDITASTTEILTAVNQHTASASQQSAAINQTSTTINEIRAASEQTADKAKAVAEQAKSSVEVSDEGTHAVETIARSMEEIRERVEAIARDILTLSEQTQQIGEITATVNDLADQSNILALNASIEAAKAGEQGKGFAVVATEVRNLAEQSKGATAQVRRILGDIQQATTAAVLATEQGTKVVEEGLTLSDRAGQGIRSLAETIREASHAAQQIAASAHEQSVGMDQIADAMRDVNDGTSQFVAGAQQSQRAAEDLNKLSENLAALTDRYRV